MGAGRLALAIEKGRQTFGALFENAILLVRIQWDGRKSLFTSFLPLVKIRGSKNQETTDAVSFPPAASKEVGF